MSTVKSTPPTDPNRSFVNGFNDQTHFDPFLPSSPSDEELLQLASDLSSGLGPSNTPSPSPFTNLTDFDLHCTPPSQSIESNHFYPFSPTQLPTNGFHEASTALGPYDRDGLVSSKDDFLSPSIYPSDNGYTELSERSETPHGEGEKFLGLTLLADPGQDLKSSFLSNEHDQFGLEPKSADTCKSEYTHRASNGTTHSSHLMSPTLTDRASPDSRAEGASPPMHEQGTGDHLYFSKASLNGGEDHLDNTYMSVPMQHTPALTGSSTANSPDRSFAPLGARAASPIVRVESYRRGDSPARADPLPPRIGSKRRGSASSHLSVKHDDDLSEDGEDDSPKGVSQHLGMPRNTRLSTNDVAMTSGGRAGLDPEARAHLSEVQVPNFKDLEEENQRSLKIADVHDWLARSETGNDMGSKEPPLLAPHRPRGTGRRQRAKSTGELSHANLMRLGADSAVNAGRDIPGPGLLLDEDSIIDEESDSEVGTEELGHDDVPSLPESPPAAIDVNNLMYEGSRDFRPQETAGRNSSPPPLFRAKLWQDPLYDSTDPGTAMQPVTSNDAIKKYNQCAESIETLSRVATWGTRRLSESDLQGLFNRFTFSEKDRSKPKGERRGSFLDAAVKLLPKRRGSLLKRKESDSSKAQPARAPDVEQSKRDSVGSRKESLGVPGPLQRKTSLSKAPKSPKINTGSAVAAMGNQFATLGASGSISATGAVTPANPWTSPRNVIQRSRSRSELRGAPPSPVNITGLWTKQGGPPMPALASPPNAKEDTSQPKVMGACDDDDDDDDMAEEKGVTIDFSFRADPIIPTLEGFKANVRQLNPRLPFYMIERVAHEQLRRYKKLMDFKVQHVQATSNQKCPSGKHCLDLGGEPSYLPAKSTKEPEQSHTGFSLTGPPASDDDANPSVEGFVTAAQFPAGVPMPPATRLPAEFECSLCFKVKKFYKPSDWSKHVHEDVQPFTCTFPLCAEPKSFKRKADWVRHENERHRQLEWWQCNLKECTHKCYRKDNFVQHLVREHKLPEPRVKTAKASKPAVRGPSSQKTRKPHGDDANQIDDASAEIDYVWKLVEECRHETPKNPKDEPCKFCGNMCSSWKKLTVHLAKHMEQISMPVLDVVQERAVTPETIISPIEQRCSPQATNSPTMQRSVREAPRDISSYGMAVEDVSDLSIPQLSAPAGGPYVRQHHPSTYPPPVPSQNQPQRYASPQGASFNAGYFSNGSSPSPQFNPINHHGGYGQLQPSGPENIYGTMAGSLTSEPRSTPLMNEEVYQSVYPVKPQHQRQHQPAFSHVSGEAPMYVYSGSATSYPQQSSMNGPVQMQFNPMPGMTYTTQAQTEPTQFSAKPLPLHSSQQQQEGSGYHYN